MIFPKEFNTSGANIPEEHYTIMREKLLAQGEKLVKTNRYFTIFAPRQSGKTTFFRLLGSKLESEGYEFCYANFEGYNDADMKGFIGKIHIEIKRGWQLNLNFNTIQDFFQEIENIVDKKYVLVIDEIEGVNGEHLKVLLHGIRNLYQSRQTHSLKSIIMVGVTNITGTLESATSPFNTNEELQLPYFSTGEIEELLLQHEKATGQLFLKKCANASSL